MSRLFAILALALACDCDQPRGAADQDGTRLRRMRVYADDGTVISFPSAYDTKLGVYCGFSAPQEDGYSYCLPVGVIPPIGEADKAKYVRGTRE